MSIDPNAFSTDWDRDAGGWRGTRLGARAGAQELGCSVYELDPGAQAAPYHFHHGQEELLVVLEGTPQLRSPDGTRVLEPGAVVSFPAGPDEAHRLRNASGAPCRYLLLGTLRYPEVAEQVDTGTILALAGPGHGWAFPQGTDEDYVELSRRAVEADPGAEPPAGS